MVHRGYMSAYPLDTKRDHGINWVSAGHGTRQQTGGVVTEGTRNCKNARSSPSFGPREARLLTESCCQSRGGKCQVFSEQGQNDSPVCDINSWLRPRSSAHNYRAGSCTRHCGKSVNGSWSEASLDTADCGFRSGMAGIQRNAGSG